MKIRHIFTLSSLCLGSLAHGASVFLVAEGVINQSASGVYPFVATGDMFRLTVAYSDHFPDTDADPDLGVYLPTDLSILLEIIGKGVAFQSVGGSVNVLAQPEDFPVYSIISQIQPNGHSLFLVFTDLDRSHAPFFGDGIPIDFGQYEDYDSISFSIVDFDANVIPGGTSTNPMDGSVTSLSIPEPSVALISGIAFTLGAMRRRRIPEVEQDAP